MWLRDEDGGAWASLTGAKLTGANLAWANLFGANLRYAIGNAQEIKSMQVDTWMVVWTADQMAIGCQQHPIGDWWDFSDAQIAEMDTLALEWWRKWKPILQQIIEVSA